MSTLQQHIEDVFTAELQFRLASAVRIASTMGSQPLDLPIEWSHGAHIVKYEEVALRQDQAEHAAEYLQLSATYLMAVAMKDAIRAAVADPKSSTNPEIVGAYQISRLIRNAFAHAPFSPVWSIDPDCVGKVFSVTNVVTLSTVGLQGKPFDWRHYGGPLALFRLSRFVRTSILQENIQPRKVIPIPREQYIQQGGLILKRVAGIPEGAEPVELPIRPDGGLDIGGGHVLYPTDDDGAK